MKIKLAMAFNPLDLGIKLLLAVVPLIISFFILSDSFRRRFNYILDLGKHADILFSTMDMLEGKMKDLQDRMGNQATIWKNQVQDLKNEVDELREEYKKWEEESLFRRIWSAYGIAVRTDFLQEKLKALQNENVQDDNLPPPPAVQMSDGVVHVPGLESLLYEALLCLCLKDNGLNVIGIYGTGGIGKTTLLTLINNFLAWMLMVCPVSENGPRVIGANTLPTMIYNFLNGTRNDFGNQVPEEYKFNHVVWATASKEIGRKDLQDMLAGRMRITLSHTSNLELRAQEIHEYMKEKSFLVLLDDLWAPRDLKELGIPDPKEANIQFKRKLIFTTRFEEVCNSMQTKKRIKVQLLSTGSAWQLFNGTLNLSDDEISIAEDIVEECGGLPLALKAIRDSISSGNSMQVWEDARSRLKKSNFFPGMENMLDNLQHSYDSLNEVKMKRCFLCCVLWPKGASIDQDELIRFWMGLELLDKHEVDKSYNQGREYLRKLKGVGLLEPGDNEDREVKMHNMIRVMALKIAFKQYRWMVQAGFELEEAPGIVEQWKEMDGVSLMFNMIRTLPDFADPIHFPRLSILMLQQNLLNGIPLHFFSRMPNLTCLDLSRNNLPPGLPHNISRLKGLRFINLSNAGIRSLPQEFWQLETLKCLILRDIHELELSIPTTVQMKLQELDLYGSSGAWQNTEENIFERLRYLQVLKITVRSARMLRNLSALSRVKLWRIGIERTRNFKHLDLNQITQATHMQQHLQELTISSLSIREVRNEWRTDVLSNLRSLSISGCPNLSNISWVLRLPQLRDLRVHSCHEMTTLINDDERERSHDACPLLNNLYLEELPNLEGMDRWVSRFPYLMSIQATGCPNLGTLPPGWQEGDPIGSKRRYLKIQVGG